MQWGPGDVAVVRDVWQGVVLTGRPETVVTDSDDLTGLYLAPGTTWITAPEYGTRTEAYERAAAGELGARAERRWTTNHRLMLMRPGDAYSVMGFWREADDEFVCWYVNLQAPYRRTPIGFDTMDHVLDIIVSPDLSNCIWKDENEGRLVVELGLATQDMFDQIRAAGQRVIEMAETGRAWWTEWRDWVRDASWPIPTLPDGWDETPAVDPNRFPAQDAR